MVAPNFWKHKTLNEMTNEEWEALCDRCGQCCLHKLEDEDTGEIFYTNVACRLLNIHSGRCSNYCHRTQVVGDCISLRKNFNEALRWLPKTCAYRLISEGKELFNWHPLISGTEETVHLAGISISTQTIVLENEVDDLEDHIIE
ncbi:YcgN family cysteine cluster protein [Candidatus Nitrosacidococcus sp. I8]|uniref:YcgN family cysteine cluster protein n=1 Tax=Candidatus Nitrosacidococcus sp. I8 TaxID=2942908 RepID=UPI0022274763|nr:YcgN family cysteine cluster protein [Candidatus Nitrosacidococcus sp. I8]CAH9018056.1 hypothetical protein NURINAE_00701 [Candidatus Nitrosacidococcus sp. I8]